MKFICESKKYIIGGPKEDSIGLLVPVDNLPEKINVEGHELIRRSYFHVTLVAIGRIADKYNVNIPDFVNKVISDFCDFVKDSKINFIRFRNEFRFTIEDEKRSVVAMCDVSNLNKFFILINKKYGLNIEYPPTHVTLYTLQPDVGIFVTNSEDIEKLTKQISNPNLVLG